VGNARIKIQQTTEGLLAGRDRRQPENSENRNGEGGRCHDLSMALVSDPDLLVDLQSFLGDSIEFLLRFPDRSGDFDQAEFPQFAQRS